MESPRSNQSLVDSKSPSIITDYFSSSKGKTRGAKKHAKTKEQPMSKTHIYLTPESSPGTSSNLDSTRDGDEIIANKNVDLDPDSCFDTVSNKDDISDKVASNESHLLADYLTSSSSNMSDSCNAMPSHLASTYPCNNSTGKAIPCKPEQVTAEKVLPNHENTQQSNHEIFTPVRRNKSATISKHNESAPSSPSLPRPKLRKGAKSKSKNDVLPTAQNEPIKPKPGRRKKKEQEPVQKNVITDFFPVRRSGRITKSEIEKDKHHQLEQQILSKCEHGLQIAEIDCKGRGIITTKDFLKGDFVVEYAGELLDVSTAEQKEKDYAANPQIGCYMYFFSVGTKQYCVDATSESGRLGRLINHSREGNCCTKAVMVQDKPRLVLVAKRDIKSGEELSYDYGDRSKAALQAHPWLKS